MTIAILPGATIGVLGSGQLGRMLALEARAMGYRVHTLSPDSDSPTGQLADVEITASYEDLEAVSRFAAAVDVVTFEFENVSSAAAQAAEGYAPVRPGGNVLHIAQHRSREKRFLREGGFPVAPFRDVSSLAELEEGLEALGYPAILKTAGFGYDGKGQVRISAPEDAAQAWKSLKTTHGVLEAFVRFEKEISVVAARGVDGSLAHFGVFENKHRNHILDVTLSPGGVEGSVGEQAIEVAFGILEALDAVGVVCVEFFLEENGSLLVNEIAPRPHNSGHLTVDASVTSQFEQQLRAVCGLPLGSTELLRPAAMANLLGDLWQGGEPNWAAACSIPGVKLHLYGKEAPRPGRKMGHLTALAETVHEAERRVLEARQALTAG